MQTKTDKNERVAQTDLFLGVDVGGTGIKLGLVDTEGRVLAKERIPTHAAASPETDLLAIQEAVNRMLDQVGASPDRLVSVGLGTPGPMDIPRGMLLTPVNLPGWHHFPIRDRLAELLNRPVRFANDAAAAAYGEFWQGRGRDCGSLVLLTLGTGVGGGIIVDEVSVDGAHSHGAEVGHIAIVSDADARICSCGKPGHLEAYASATAVVGRTREILAASDRPSALRQEDRLTALDVANAASGGDCLARQIVAETAQYLADGIAILAHVIDPEIVLLGGAMNFGGDGSELGRWFLDRVRNRVVQSTFPMVAENMKIEYASLGGDAGLVGAAGLARRDHLRQIARRDECH